MKKLLTLLLIVSLSFNFLSAQSKIGLKDDKVSNKVQKMSTNYKFDYNCLINDPVWYLQFNQWQTEEQIVDYSPYTVSDQEENEFGDQMYEQMKSSGDYTFIETGDVLKGLQEMVDLLLSARPDNHSGLKYTVHLLDDDETINAYTAGGHIYVTTGIIKFLESTSELAVIMAHEIGHNENKDIKRTLMRYKGAGEFGDVALMVKNILTVSWNQFNEIRCDQYGILLSHAAGYDACKTVQLWERFATTFDENPDAIENFFRTHPYSAKRAECAGTFMANNNLGCK